MIISYILHIIFSYMDIIPLYGTKNNPISTNNRSSFDIESIVYLMPFSINCNIKDLKNVGAF